MQQRDSQNAAHSHNLTQLKSDEQEKRHVSPQYSINNLLLTALVHCPASRTLVRPRTLQRIERRRFAQQETTHTTKLLVYRIDGPLCTSAWSLGGLEIHRRDSSRLTDTRLSRESANACLLTKTHSQVLSQVTMELNNSDDYTRKDE